MRWFRLILIVLSLCIILFYILPFLMIAFCEPVDYFPQDGIWYCEELQMQVSFADDDKTFAYVNGEKIYCTWGYDRGSTWLGLHCRNYYSKAFQVGDVVFDGEYVSLNDKALVLYDQEINRDYTFLRLPDQ